MDVSSMFGNAVFRRRDEDRPPPEPKPPDPPRVASASLLAAARPAAGLISASSAPSPRPASSPISSPARRSARWSAAATRRANLDSLEAFARSLTRRKVFGLLDLNFAGSGLISGNRLSRLLEARLKDVRIEDLKHGYVAVATELGTGHEVWMSRGRLVDAMRASYALPGIFQPVRVNGRWLVDGALVNPVPVSAARALGAELVIAVNLQTDVFGRGTIVHDHSAEPIAEQAISAATATCPEGSDARRILRRQLIGEHDGPPGILVGDGRGLQHHPGSHRAFAAGRRDTGYVRGRHGNKIQPFFTG